MNIPDEARSLQLEIWNSQNTLLPGQDVQPLDVLRPELAAIVLGLEYLEMEDLKSVFAFRGQKFEVAGLIDRQSRRIAVSRNFPPETCRFTAAHEIGHWLLHPGETLHRDRPISSQAGSSNPKPPIEKQADKFAAYFLMPPKLLEHEFKMRFGSYLPFEMDDTSAFYLCPDDPGALLWASQDSYDREYAFARCTTFNGKSFDSLAKCFGVSDTAMAIQIREIGLIKWP